MLSNPYTETLKRGDAHAFEVGPYCCKICDNQGDGGHQLELLAWVSGRSYPVIAKGYAYDSTTLIEVKRFVVHSLIRDLRKWLLAEEQAASITPSPTP